MSRIEEESTDLSEVSDAVGLGLAFGRVNEALDTQLCRLDKILGARGIIAARPAFVRPKIVRSELSAIEDRVAILGHMVERLEGIANVMESINGQS